MKNSIFKKIVFALMAAFLVCTVAEAFESPGKPELAQLASGTPAVLMAVAPAIVAFNPENLKIPQSEFETLRVKYGRLYVLDVVIDDDEKYQFIVCRPTREIISAIANSRDNIDKANDIIIKNMVVGGDLDALKDGLVFAKVLQDIGGIIKQGKTFLSKA